MQITGTPAFCLLHTNLRGPQVSLTRPFICHLTSPPAYLFRVFFPFLPLLLYLLPEVILGLPCVVYRS